MGTADDGEVAPEALQPTHISVHVHQESALAKLLLAGCSLLRLPALPGGTAPQTLSNSRLLVASWVVQLVLGVLSGILGGFLYIYRPTRFCYLGAAIWTGAVAVLAGVAGFLYEKRGGICWALLRTLLILASFCTAIAAIVIGASSFHEYHYFADEDDCKIYSENWPTKSPITPSPKEVRRLNLCISQVNMLRALVISLQAMLMGVWVLLLLASLAPLCLYCWRRFPPKKKSCFQSSVSSPRAQEAREVHSYVSPLVLFESEKTREETTGSKWDLALSTHSFGRRRCSFCSTCPRI
ncbi:transmembrane protein 176A isoform X1 [Marmota monax]|uniref:transmembrane protein 176A isoform X1 n=1 Tax=Marmota monax TaxID=9995 RepID=UPI001EB06CB9|nr:transmembrane protein 176A isoform X1 [Marmota monax]